MREKVFILVFSGILSATALPGQCPGNDSLWNRIAFLGTTTISPADKLRELLEWEKKIKQCSVPSDTTHALLLQKIGSLYFSEADYIQAIKYTQQSINITVARKEKSLPQSKLLIKKYYDLSRMYDSLHNVRKRLVALDSCAAIASRINAVDTYYLFAVYARAQYFFDIGDYNRCISYASFCEKLGYQYTENNPDDKYNTGMWYAFSSLGWIINSLLRMEDYEGAEKLLSNKVKECKKAGLKNYLGTLYGQLAEVQEQRGEYNKALSLYNQALEYETKWGANYNCKVIFNNIGYLYGNHLKDMQMALFYYKKALQHHDRNKPLSKMDSLEMLNISSNIGNTYSKKNQFDSAYVYFQRGFDYVRSGITETGILKSSLDEFVQQKKMGYLTGLLINKGDAYRRQYKVTGRKDLLEASVRVYKISDKVLDRIRNEQTDPQSKLFWRSDTRRLYENAIDACYLQGKPADAFYFFEKGRAVLLNDQLNEQHWMDESDILKQTQLKKRILQLEKELSNAGASANNYALIKTEIFTAKQELDRLGQLIKESNPVYYQSFLDTGFITLQDVQQNLLKKSHALLEIFSGDSAVYALLVTAKNSYLTKINKQDFEITANKYISWLSDANLMNKKFGDFVKTSNHLYNLIFQKSQIPGSRIIISPDGKYFPFEALVTSGANQQLTYFLNNHAVSYTYSARFLMNDFISGSATTGKNFMGIAPVNYPSAFSLAALPGSDRSLNKISSYFKNAVNQVASHASRNNFMQQFSQYRIIQLYTHASDSSSHNEPVIYFADSALYLSDLINENKPLTRLVVLSACETGTGKIYHGEGVFSFNRGFAALGIPAAITNLWSVDNTSTYMLTELFYKWLAKGLPTDVALQKAKLEFLKVSSKEKSMPCYWAGPVLVGKVDVIELSEPYPWKWIVLFLSIGCISFFAVRKWAISKKA